MADLAALIEARGYKDVRTLVQSGNVVFSGPQRSREELESQFEQSIARKLKVECSCFVRSAAEWAALLKDNPYPREAKDDPAHLQVVLLKTAATTPALKELRAAIVGRERVEAGGHHLYAVYPDGMGTSKFTLTVIEKKLSTRATARNWNTVEKVAGLLLDQPVRPARA
jgi:uncharacterized protein (DUF1697 family)